MTKKQFISDSKAQPPIPSSLQSLPLLAMKKQFSHAVEYERSFSSAKLDFHFKSLSNGSSLQTEISCLTTDEKINFVKSITSFVNTNRSEMSFPGASCFRCKVTFISTHSRCQRNVVWGLREWKIESIERTTIEPGTWNEFAITECERNTCCATLCCSLFGDVRFLLPSDWWKLPPTRLMANWICSIVFDYDTSVTNVNWILCPQGTLIYGSFVVLSSPWDLAARPIFAHWRLIDNNWGN